MQTGAMWMIGFKLADRGLGFISTLILARLLVPADFGIVAMATAVSALIELFSAFGLDVALIRAESGRREYFDTAWTLNVCIGAGIFALILLASPIAASYFGQPMLRQALSVLAFGSLIQGFENIGTVNFRREMRFHAEFAFLIAKRLVTMACVIPLAFALRSWWALVAGIVIGKLASLVISYIAHPYRPRFSLAAASYFVHFSKWMIIVNALSFFLQRSSDLILGRTSGPRALGLYSVSAELGNLPTTELIAPINRAVYPAYARLARNLEALRQEYLSVIGAIALLGIPAAMGVVATAKFMVPTLLGQKWLDAVPLVQLLGVFGLTQILQANIYSVYLAIGKPRLQVVIHFIQLVALVTGLILLTPTQGAMGAAKAALLAAATVLPVNLAIAFRQLGVRTVQFLASIWRPLLCAGIMLAAIRLLFPLDVPTSTKTAAYYLVSAVIFGAATYVVTLFSLWWLVGKPWSAERWLLGRALSAMERLGLYRSGGGVRKS
jgi:lipopolysaccharide exporter